MSKRSAGSCQERGIRRDTRQGDRWQESRQPCACERDGASFVATPNHEGTKATKNRKLFSRKNFLLFVASRRSGDGGNICRRPTPRARQFLQTSIRRRSPKRAR